MTLNIAIAGIMGRMGQTLVPACTADARVQLAAGSIVPEQQQAATQQFGSSILLTQKAEELINAADAVIDFTAPAYSLELASLAAKHGKVHIVGTTGFTAAQLEQLKVHGKNARIVQSGNFSIGVNVTALLVEQAAKLLDESYDIEISEMHHRHKKDAPSGTALLLGEAAAQGRGVKLAEKKITYADGMTGERPKGAIGITAMRGGEVIGDHNVMFAGTRDIVEITHRSQSREIYAGGALCAALWAAQKPAGFYTMRDVLGLRL